MEAVNGAAGYGAENIGFFFHGGHFYAAGRERLLGFRNEHFSHQQRAGRGHDNGGEKIRGVCAADMDVGGHHAAGDVSHAAGHHSHEFGNGENRKKRSDRERRLGLAHENAGGDIERLGATGAHDFSHEPCSDADDKLHDTDVVEHSEKSGDKNDGWKDLKGEDESEAGIGLAEFAEDKGRTNVRKIEEMLGAIAQSLKNNPAGGHLQDEDAKNDLQAEAPENGFELDGFAIG